MNLKSIVKITALRNKKMQKFHRKQNMAIWEIHKRFGLLDYLWWKFVPGTTINVKWPTGDIVVDSNHPQWYDCGAVKVLIHSADPNDHYRPWLEEHVGKQKRDWNWRMNPRDSEGDTLQIKFRKGKEKFATLAAIRWM